MALLNIFHIDINKIFELLKYNEFDPLLFGTSLFLMLFIGVLLALTLLRSSRIMRQIFIILFSFYFYYKITGGHFYFLFIAALVNFGFGYIIQRSEIQWKKALTLAIGITVNLGVLFYFKYLNFVLESIFKYQHPIDPNAVDVIQPAFQALDIIRLAGLSYFTFKAISYLIDTYWEMLEFNPRFDEFLLYLSFFPSLMQGPIDKARDFLPQLRENKFLKLTDADISRGIYLIMLGLIKAYVIAEYLKNPIDRVFDDPMRATGAENLIAVYAYTLRLYCDFSGYTDIAVGISALMGYKIMANFNFPYLARNIADFWRRWHISLSTWLQTYLFTPLQLSMRGLGIFGNALAMFITFILCGLWHGPSWNFILWGAIHATLLSLNVLLRQPKAWLYKKLWIDRMPFLGLFQILITFHLVAFAWVIFAAKDIPTALDIFKQIFTFLKPEVFSQYAEAAPLVVILMAVGYIFHFLPGLIDIKIESLLCFQKLFSGSQGVSNLFGTWHRWAVSVKRVLYGEPILYHRLYAKMPFYAQALLFALVIYFVNQFRFQDILPPMYFRY